MKYLMNEEIITVWYHLTKSGNILFFKNTYNNIYLQDRNVIRPFFMLRESFIHSAVCEGTIGFIPAN